MSARLLRIGFPVIGIFVSVVSVSTADRPKSATRPAAAGKGRVDLCDGVIDPYDPGAERMRFFRAAGVDNELDDKEFQTDHATPKGFVRKYDRWPALLVFDKNRNTKIDWFEADAYRRDIRKRVLAAFDADKDKRLTGEERKAANRSLARGAIPGLAGPRVIPGEEHLPPPPPSPYYRPDYNALKKRFDADGDGRLTREEWQAVHNAAKAEREKWQLERHDKNKDGRLDDTERKAIDEERKAYSRALSRRAELRAWDKNRDGKLNETEQAALNEYKERIRRQAAEGRRRYQEMIKRHDADGDGKLNEEERKAMYEEYRRLAEVRRWDANKDGVLDEREHAAMEAEKARWKRRAEAQKRWMLARWDKDGDGELSMDERRRMSEDYRRKWMARWDRDGDGELSPAERGVMYEITRARYAKRRRLMDADDDGQVTPEETRAYQKRNLAKYDANKDGWLDNDEREKLNDDLDKME